MGIEGKLQDTILHRDTQPDTIQEYIDAAHAEIKKYQNRQSIKHPGAAKFQWTGERQPFMPHHFGTQHRNGQHVQHINPNDQTVFMDVQWARKPFQCLGISD
jgi:hypothetical protein